MICNITNVASIISRCGNCSTHFRSQTWISHERKIFSHTNFGCVGQQNTEWFASDFILL